MRGRLPRFYDAAGVRELERRALASGIGGYTLMQRAAAAAWRELTWQWPRAQRIAVVCGPGNNGGDGYALACLARAAGSEVGVFQIGEPGQRPEAAQARRHWRRAALPFEAASLDGTEVVVDAVFGIGLTRAPSGPAARAIGAINAARERGAGVIALDVPSGVDADRGVAPGVAVRAEVTVTFIGAKRGLHTAFGPDFAGHVIQDDLGLDEEIFSGVPGVEALDAGSLAAVLPRRAPSAHKGGQGHVLLIGGDEGMGGALLLAARGAQRAGAGLVSVAMREAYVAAITAAQPELMCHGIEAPRGLRALLERASVIALGPGLGRGAWSGEVFSQALSGTQPVVIDADGLNWLAENPQHRDHWVLTPHPGEAARLLGVSTREVQADRFGAARALQEKFGGVAVLKGAGTIVQGERTALCALGNPGMAVGGTGDVLCGVIAGLIAQGLSLEDAARAGVTAHALAGDACAARGLRGMTPSDLVAALRAKVQS